MISEMHQAEVFINSTKKYLVFGCVNGDNVLVIRAYG